MKKIILIALLFLLLCNGVVAQFTREPFVGRITNPQRRGISRVYVVVDCLTISSPVSAYTNQFGYFTINRPTDCDSLMRWSKKRYVFFPSHTIITLNEPAPANLLITGITIPP